MKGSLKDCKYIIIIVSDVTAERRFFKETVKTVTQAPFMLKLNSVAIRGKKGWNFMLQRNTMIRSQETNSELSLGIFPGRHPSLISYSYYHDNIVWVLQILLANILYSVNMPICWLRIIQCLLTNSCPLLSLLSYYLRAPSY